MPWMQSHLASLPADIEEELTSSAWASVPRVHREQTSKQEKDINAFKVTRADIEAREVDRSACKH